MCCFPVKINKMWNFCLILWFFEEPLITETWNLQHWIWHASNPTYVLLKPFQSIFSSQTLTNVKFWLFPELPLTKTEKTHQFSQGKSVYKDLQICTYRFLGMPIAMHFVTTLCDKYFLSYYGFSAFVMGRSRYRVLKHCVGVKCDPRRTAAYVPSHFHGFEPHLLLCVS